MTLNASPAGEFDVAPAPEDTLTATRAIVADLEAADHDRMAVRGTVFAFTTRLLFPEIAMVERLLKQPARAWTDAERSMALIWVSARRHDPDVLSWQSLATTPHADEFVEIPAGMTGADALGLDPTTPPSEPASATI